MRIGNFPPEMTRETQEEIKKRAMDLVRKLGAPVEHELHPRTRHEHAETIIFNATVISAAKNIVVMSGMNAGNLMELTAKFVDLFRSAVANEFCSVEAAVPEYFAAVREAMDGNHAKLDALTMLSDEARTKIKNTIRDFRGIKI